MENITINEELNELITSLTRKYSMSLESEVTHIKLSNTFVKLDFYRDFGMLECNLYLIHDTFVYSLKGIPFYGFDSNFKLDFNHIVNAYVKVIELFLNDTFLYGDFSWVENYKNNLNTNKARLKKVYELPNDNKIHIKFLKNDPSWEMDLLLEYPELK